MFKTKIAENNSRLSQLTVSLDKYNKMYAVSEGMDTHAIKIMLIIPTKDDMEKEKFEVFKWENKLRVLNGGKNKIKYDLDRVKEISIEQILNLFGVEHKRYFFRLREGDKTPSCNFSQDKNLWVDHGTGKGGSVIDLYMELAKCDVKEALRELNNLI